jgi:hypothetical protein
MTIIILELGFVCFIGFEKNSNSFQPNRFIENSIRIKVLATNLSNVATLLPRNKHKFRVVAKIKLDGWENLLYPRGHNIYVC